MKVEKKINNNLVRSVDERGKEVLVMGCGLGFKKAVGDEIDPERIEKIYTMKDREEYGRLEEILAGVPLECIQMTNEIVEYARISMGGAAVNDSIYLTLCDHISFALERMKTGLILHNALLTEIRRFYPFWWHLSWLIRQGIPIRLSILWQTRHFISCRSCWQALRQKNLAAIPSWL